MGGPARDRHGEVGAAARSSAESGPPRPRWRSWLLPIGLVLSLVLLLVPNQMQEGRVTDLTYQPELKDKLAACRLSGPVGSSAVGRDGGIGRARSRVFDAERPDTTFGDVAGYVGVKREVSEVVDFLKHPERYRRAGAVGPKGVLMVGPPGTGKTLLARRRPGPGRIPGQPQPIAATGH